nr:sulfotransferase domain-containing protein [Marinobacter nauticus]
MNTFDDILKCYIFKPETFWPDDTVFHRRNRDKLVKARAQVKDLDDDTLKARLKEDLEKRYEKERKTLYVISCGSSGCHFLGEMLSSIGNFDLIKEVYYPPELLRLCRESELSEKERMMLFDLVSYFPSRGVKKNKPDVVPVNIMHLRPDTPTRFVKEMGGHHIILLMRNPFDIAYSRTFRKDDYRAEADPSASDKDYLSKQINNVKRFYRLASQDHNVFDDIVRYEDLVRDPYAAVHDLLFVAKEKFPEGWRDKDGLKSVKSKASSDKSINYNSKPKKYVGAEFSHLLEKRLSVLSGSLGYFVPEYLSR